MLQESAHWEPRWRVGGQAVGQFEICPESTWLPRRKPLLERIFQADSRPGGNLQESAMLETL